jgi:hypothetical protein
MALRPPRNGSNSISADSRAASGSVIVTHAASVRRSKSKAKNAQQIRSCSTIPFEEVAAWEHDRNNNHTKADWQFTTADARIKLKSLYPTL